MSSLQNREHCIGRRIAPRTRCSIVVEIKDGASEWRRAQLEDISASGFRLTRLQQPPSGNSLWLRPEGLDPIAAKVRWSAQGAVGCEFLYAIDDATQEAIKQLAARGPVPAPIREVA